MDLLTNPLNPVPDFFLCKMNCAARKRISPVFSFSVTSEREFMQMDIVSSEQLQSWQLWIVIGGSRTIICCNADDVFHCGNVEGSNVSR